MKESKDVHRSITTRSGSETFASVNVTVILVPATPSPFASRTFDLGCLSSVGGFVGLWACQASRRRRRCIIQKPPRTIRMRIVTPITVGATIAATDTCDFETGEEVFAVVVGNSIL